MYTGKILKQKREKLGLTQREIADHLGYSTAQYISNIERGACEVPKEKIDDLAEILKCNPKLFIDALVEKFKNSM